MAPPPPRRMRSTAVNLGLVGALALSLSGCGTNRTQVAQRQCVDDFGQVVAEAQCLATPGPSSSARSGTRSRSPRWYYGETTAGGRVTGGSYDPPPSGSRANSSSGATSGGVDTGGLGGKSTSNSSSGGKSGGSSSSGGS